MITLLALGTLLFVAGAAVDSSGYSFVEVEGHDFVSKLLTGLVLTTALALGLTIAVAGVGAAMLRGRRQGGPGLKLMAAVPLAMIAMTALLLALVDRQTEPPVHPANVQSGPLASAVLVADGLGLPTGLAATADGIIFWTAPDSAAIGVAAPDGAGGYTISEFAAMADLNAVHPWHIVLHPDWDAEPYVYVSATYRDEADELWLGIFRFRNEGLRGEDAALIVGGMPPGLRLEESPTERGIHIGSALAFCEGYLYLSIGDNHLRASDQSFNLVQDPREPYGKILRYRLDGIDLEPDGLLAADPPVFAMGFRNPFGMDCAHNLGIPVVADNGPTGHDQVRYVQPGSNHEWPITDARDRLSTPLFTSGSTPLGVSGVAWVNSTTMLLTTVNPQSVYSLQLDDSGDLAAATVYFQVEGPAIAVTRGANHCTYVADTSRIWRIIEDSCPE